MKTALTLAALLAFPVSSVFAADESGFRPIFNGNNLDGWHLRHKDRGSAWSVAGGILKNTIDKGNRGTDLVTDDKFWNFTIRYDFMVPDGSNSGLYLRGRHELQILGDFQSGKISVKSNGAIYNFKAPSDFASRPADEWQTVEATIIHNRITVVLNGKTIHKDVECNSATGGEIDNDVGAPGPILLQGDHGTVSFRNLRIKVLPRD
jgi:hypothetical protein